MEVSEKNQLKRERWKLLVRIQKIMEGPMIFLAFAWLILLIIELTKGLTPDLEITSIFIWIIFIADFLFKLILAPRKNIFLKKNILTMVSLLIPALRIAKIFRIFRILRSIRLVKVLSSVNRSMRSLAATISRRAFGYVLLLTVIVIFAGAAGMLAFEREVGSITTYSTSLWFTSMIVITIGTEQWPQTPEGRILCFLLALYGFAMLGYLTATLATFFLGKDAEEDRTASANTNELRKEIAELKALVRSLKRE